MALTDKITAVADAIREVSGSSGLMTLAEMPDKIRNIEPTPTEYNIVAKIGDTGKYIDNADTTKTSAMEYRFAYLPITEVTALPDFTNFKSLLSTFSNCKKLKALNLSGKTVSKIQTTANMLECCYLLKTVDMSGILSDTSQLNNMANTFLKCSSLGQIIWPDSMDCTKGNDFNNMFQYCYNLKTVDFTNWTFKNSVNTPGTYGYNNLNSIFSSTPALTTLNLGDNDFSRCSNFSWFSGSNGYPYYYEYGLREIGWGSALSFESQHVSSGTNFNLMCVPLKATNVVRMFNALTTTTKGIKISLNPTTYNSLTEDELAIATGKGYTVQSTGYPFLQSVDEMESLLLSNTWKANGNNFSLDGSLYYVTGCNGLSITDHVLTAQTVLDWGSRTCTITVPLTDPLLNTATVVVSGKGTYTMPFVSWPASTTATNFAVLGLTGDAATCGYLYLYT